MPADPLLLGLDLGTSRFKAVLVDGVGRAVGSASERAPFVGAEMGVPELLGAVGRLLAQLDQRARRRVAAAGIAGLAESGAPLDRHGAALAPVIAWHDPRGAEVVDRLHHRLGSGLDRALGQELRVVSTVAKLGWLLDHEVQSVACWLGVPELVLFALTGRAATEFSLAARTGAYHVGQRRWLGEVMEELGVAGVFPPVEAAGSSMGVVSPAAAHWTGVPAGIPVTVAGHDHLVGLMGAGVGASEVANSVGTAETVLRAMSVMPDVERAIASRVAVTLLPEGKGWALLASAVRSGVVVAAVSEALGSSPAALDGCAEVAGEWAEVGDAVLRAALAGGAGGRTGAAGLASVLGEALALGAGGEAGAAGLASGGGAMPDSGGGAMPDSGGGAMPDSGGGAMPDSGGGAMPDSGGGAMPDSGGGAMPDSGGGAMPDSGGGAMPESGAIWGGLLSTLSRRTWAAVDRLENLARTPLTGLVVFGGGSKSDVWMRAKAGLRPEVPLWRTDEPDAAGRGAALYAGMAAGWWPAPQQGPKVSRERIAPSCSAPPQ